MTTTRRRLMINAGGGIFPPAPPSPYALAIGESLYVVYDRPRDYPDLFVCRRWNARRHSSYAWHHTSFIELAAEPNIYASARTIDALRAQLPPVLVWFPIRPGSDYAILEMWKEAPPVMDPIVCPDCGGRKVTGGFDVVFSASSLHEVSYAVATCQRCNGEGVISPEINAQIVAGEELRADRLRRNVSVLDEAARLGISPSELSRRERGIFGKEKAR
jgi:hypothetical protein